MTRNRILAAIAAIITALLLQATVVAPVTMPVAVSLPAVLVAAVALVEGPGTGLAIGFVTGLLADLGSHHPAGILALCWLAVGIVCGQLAGVRSVRMDAAAAAVVCALASVAAGVLLALTRSGSSLTQALAQLVPAVLGDALLALAVVPLVRAMLRSGSLRPARTVTVDFAARAHRG